MNRRLFITTMSIAATAQAQSYKVGDRVEAYAVGWNKGTVVEVGTGNYQGYFLVKYDSFSTQRYFKPSNLKPGGPPDAPKTYPAYRVGDRVEGYDFGWHAARVTESRKGKDSPEYLLQYEKFSSARWYHPKDMRAFGAGEAEKTRDQAATVQGPRLGKYGIYSYGAVAAAPLYLGHFELMEGGKYRISRTSAAPYYGEGTYRFNGAAAKVEWLSGPLAEPGWGGAFSVEGTRHRIGLRARTVATNSQ